MKKKILTAMLFVSCAGLSTFIFAEHFICPTPQELKNRFADSTPIGVYALTQDTYNVEYPVFTQGTSKIAYFYWDNLKVNDVSQLDKIAKEAFDSLTLKGTEENVCYYAYTDPQGNVINNAADVSFYDE